MPRGNGQRRGRGGYTPPSRDEPRRFTPNHHHKRNILLGIDGFTLADEARSTAHRTSTWTGDSRLRSRPVSFVSAGCVDPLKQLEEQLQRKAVETLGHMLYATDGIRGASTKSQESRLHMELPPRLVASDASQANAADLTDSAEVAAALQFGGRSSHTARKPESSPLPALALDRISSQEENNRPAAPRPLPSSITGSNKAPAAIQMQDPDSPVFFFDTTGDVSGRRESQAGTEEARPRDSSISASCHISEPETSEEDIILFKGRHHRKGVRSSLGGASKPITSMTEEIFDLHEMQAEIQVVGGSSRHHLPHALDSAPVALRVPALSTRSQKRREKNEKKKNKKNRKSQRGGEAVVKDFLPTEDDEALLADYIANMQQHGSSDEDVTPDSAHADCETGVSSTYNPRSTVIMGLGDDDEDSPLSGAPSPDDVDRNLSGDDLASAMAGEAGLLDAYKGSPRLGPDDVLYRHSTIDRLSRRSKGQRPRFLNLSDSELEDEMLSAFESSRLKKAEKRKEREMLRSQGLLGSKIRGDDLRTKYQTGMTLEHISNELKTFLVGSQPSLILPPMDNQARKVIHELANKFNIKSKSTGSGDQRRPTLYRTIRTFKYSEEAFNMTISRVGRKYFPRRDRLAGPGPRPPHQDQGGGRALSYRDGEIVGGSAPELGEGNKGRRMLEKMGWSSGTALGTTFNKGILQPVEQKVKRGKAGLG